MSDYAGLLYCLRDFDWTELQRLATDHLGIAPANIPSVMPDGDLDKRAYDLVEWADRRGAINGLIQGIALEGSGKRSVREWLLKDLSADMPPPSDPLPTPTSYSSLERRFERLEENVHNRLTYVERELQHLAVAVQSKGHESTAVNWTIVIAAILIAVSVAGATTIMALVR